mmetsp:Transcript_9094/g.12925  ORF Transcript_9094/g.12925 Transcript_9094/m.12925 type:complete len:274 (-) Transcript_9094:680-1501(-)|eukprot:CAMPEP_0184871138 /NCGR_PEP_ID=MMETSP0580-20130426/40116_1 /TAXON_ID=1118495 /ORGANISM="Dactyliosolen fragilissimus" /LENGTH=273 /DNA_ID=CAMNT_0027373685 /DNA_START=1773 /DNA_END=2594 /DNA_ORIENTATION=+
MIETWPELKKDLVCTNRKDVIYLRIIKVFYGCIQSALLWYNVFKNKLEEFGFKINPYNRCVVNKLIDNKQYTITWYVDDVKVSLVDHNVVTNIIKVLQEEYRDLKPSRGTKHSLLGINIEFKSGSTLNIDTSDHLKETIQGFPDDIPPPKHSPADKEIFAVNKNSPRLNEKQANVFHSTCAKFMWIMKWGHPDVKTPISFLCTRVNDPTKEDWNKLKRVLSFISGTISNKRRVGISNIYNIITMVDASHAVHNNMCGHTSGLISMGVGVMEII